MKKVLGKQKDSDHFYHYCHYCHYCHYKTRPLPQSKISVFAREIQNLSLEEVINEKVIDTNVYNFHRLLLLICEKHFPEQIITISKLDKKWITPELKTLSRKIKAEFYRNGKSCRWKKLKKEFKVKKKKAITSFHSNFVKDLKQTEPCKFYRRIGTGDEMTGYIKIKSQEGLSNKNQVRPGIRPSH